MKPEDFSGSQPEFQLEDYFSGHVRAWGLFHDRFGRLRRRFVVDVHGVWDGRLLVLDEDFRYQDGAREHRTWRIRKVDDHHYEGTFDDIIGVASGVTYGHALHWTYVMRLAVGRRRLRVSFDDWMFREDGEVMINRAVMKMLGVKLGEVTLAFRKMPATAEVTAAPSAA